MVPFAREEALERIGALTGDIEMSFTLNNAIRAVVASVQQGGAAGLRHIGGVDERLDSDGLVRGDQTSVHVAGG